MINAKKWIQENKAAFAGILLVGVLVLASVLVLLGMALVGRGLSYQKACIYQDGELIETVNLSMVTGTRELVIEGGDGKNVIEIGQEGIRMLEANCPDQLCVKQGWLKDRLQPIVCLPHRVVIELQEE